MVVAAAADNACVEALAAAFDRHPVRYRVTASLARDAPPARHEGEARCAGDHPQRVQRQKDGWQRALAKVDAKAWGAPRKNVFCQPGALLRTDLQAGP